ncbi:MAG: HPr family phosphocarrier protein [Candidatus Aminicenantes bacterium]|nr:MAG: HPr family phosphocarrier protein [Candidatus Aminicenantes bacterium]
MIRETIEITNKLGLHARAAAKLSHLANRFQSNIFLIYRGDKVNAKSLLGILTLAASVGNPITIEADGKDEKKAITQMTALFTAKFDEES